MIFGKRSMILAGVVTLGLAFLLAWVSTKYTGVDGWFSFLVVLLLAWGILIGAWWGARFEQVPGRVFWLMLLAVGVRLGLAVFWAAALPVWGYDTDVQQAGYVMRDAFTRDGAAWIFAQSGEPLWLAFLGYTSFDQYGGLLFISAVIYRYIGIGVHQPLLVMVLLAAFSGLAVLFVWLTGRAFWGEKAATLAAWMMALYPEAVLLGSGHLREALTIPLAVMVVYLFERYWREKERWVLAWLVVMLAFGTAVSPPMAGTMALILLALAFVWDRHGWLKSRPGRLAVLGVILGVVIGAAVFGEDMKYWARALYYQQFSTIQVSGKLQAVFTRIPEWSHVPFLVLYGVFRPLLPAAVFDSAALLWRVVAVWRALGWTALLALFLYASLFLARNWRWRSVEAVLFLASWGAVWFGSYRGGGDLWDNPRYRATFAGFQVMLAAWALVRQKETGDPWLRRGLGMAAAMVLWFMPWYFQRKVMDIGWPVNGLGALVGLGFLTGATYVWWDMRRLRSK